MTALAASPHFAEALGVPDTQIARKWLAWHKANPQVYELFVRFTLSAINRGHSKLSAWLIINRIRWETVVETQGEDFKISNDSIAYYSRLFMYHYPEYAGFFRIKPLKGQPPTEREEE